MQTELQTPEQRGDDILKTSSSSLGSSPAQRRRAQPRQVRKEATVGNVQRVMQGCLTSFFVQMIVGKSYSHLHWHISRMLKKMETLCKNIVTSFSGSLGSKSLKVLFHRNGRCASTQQRVCIREGKFFSYGSLPLRRVPVGTMTHFSKWKYYSYEKRNYYQLDGNRESDCHS